ncbi:MAG: class I SAM-dependent methyltransferase [Rhodospirillales bacterium]|nr:class I SAM-dependent methyltransferase [Rhodospirillales bacterium]MSP80487.1 class I SAM-dependent methyltransferase [Rhodospirillales bacterium]
MREASPSPWVARHAHLIPARGPVLDLACGGGRNARYLSGRGHPVVALDRDTAVIAAAGLTPPPSYDRRVTPLGMHSHDDSLAADAPAGIEIVQADLESGIPVFDPPGPLGHRRFAGIVVVNYLYRPILPRLIALLAEGGVLIYETFARGNEKFTRPRNPDHLLRAGELLEFARGKLQIVAYEHGLLEADPIPGVKQRLAAVNDLGKSARDDGEPEPHPLAPSPR